MRGLPECYDIPISGSDPGAEVYRRDKYHHSDIYGITEGDLPKVTVHYGLHAPFCVTATEASAHLYKRSLSNIRRDRADYFILFSILSGSVQCLYNGHRSKIVRGDFFLARSNVPYELVVRPGPEDRYAQICIMLPPDLAAEFNVADIAGVPITQKDREVGLAFDLTRALFNHGRTANAPTATALLRAILLEITQLAQGSERPVGVSKTSVRNARRDAILAYLDSHCTNPDLRAPMVAEACNMSVRYMSALLAEKSLSFSVLVRLGRLHRLRSWLADRALADETIASLAYRAGFNSVSHCIASFRQHYGCSPSRLRRDLASSLA